MQMKYLLQRKTHPKTPISPVATRTVA